MHRFILTLAVATSLAVVSLAQETSDTPIIKCIVTCHNGGIDSGSSCSIKNYSPDGKIFPTGNMKAGYPGKVSEVTWKFIKHENGADVYSFNRAFRIDTSNSKTEKKTIKFTGPRIIVFKDQHQVVTIESPNNNREQNQ